MTIYNITLDIARLPEGPYLGTSPDLPGLIIQADTPDEVIRLAPDIARDLIEVMRETCQPLPRGLTPLKAPKRVALMVPA
jgi:predicted RNase H-like HicB family nuclease